MIPAHYLHWWHKGEWHEIGWVACTPKEKADLETHARNLARSYGDRYRIVTPSARMGADPTVLLDLPERSTE